MSETEDKQEISALLMRVNRLEEQHERDLDRIAHALARDEPQPGRFTKRRVPGTAVLGITNLIAAQILLVGDVFGGAEALVYLRQIGSEFVWGASFAMSSALLLAACFTRRWALLNAGSVISLFVWTAVGVSLFAAWLSGNALLSPIALALAFWMVGGQAAMLVVPLLGRRFPS